MIFSLQRTNPRLTGNVKLVITEDNKLFLESINSSDELTRFKYKGIEYNTEYTYAQNLRSFTKRFTNTADVYAVVNEQTVLTTAKLDRQYHQSYDYGCYSSNEILVKSRLRFFAPLNIDREDIDNDALPDAFCIYRLPRNNPSTSADSNVNYLEAIKSGTLVKSFDLHDHLQTVSKNFSDSKILANFSKGLTVEGLDLSTGFSGRKSESDLLSILANERTVLEFENFVTNAYQRQNMLYSNIVNFEYAFDDIVTSDFDRYIGVYVNYNETDKQTIDSYIDSGTFNLLKTKSGIVQYSEPHTLNTYLNPLVTLTALSAGSIKNPQYEIYIDFSPKAGERLQLRYNNLLEIDLEITPSLIGKTKNATAALISDAFNNIASSAEFITVSATSDGNRILLRSNSDDQVFENITVTMPATFKAKSILFNKDNDFSHFYGSGPDTVIATTYINPATTDTIQIKQNGLITSFKIVQASEYDELYLYKLGKRLSETCLSVCPVTFLQTTTEQPIICSVVDHKTLDYDVTKNYYDDVLDFDPEAYRKYLISVIGSDDYYGKLDETATEEELSLYKIEIAAQINQYFNSIVLNKQYLINDIDLITKESSSVDNEYVRLNEDINQNLTNYNKLYGFINKWSSEFGSNVYQQPYRLNVNLPFRYDNFSPSISSVERDIRYHTHGWLVLGEGQIPYYDVTEENISKILSYTNRSIVEADFTNTVDDVSSVFEYSTEIKKHASYEIIRYDRLSNTAEVFYRGLSLVFDDITLAGYKFSAVLKSKDPTDDDEVNIGFIRNDKFKTITLLVRFYVPDPILTTLERGSDNYYLDRSLLYFSNQIYSTEDASVDFGISPISLSLYNTTEQKTYLGRIVTNDWYYEISPGEYITYVKRGDLSIFKTLLSDLLDLNEDFTVFYTETLDYNDPRYGMIMTFHDIQEITDTYFWCKKISFSYVNTVETDDPKNIDDNVVIDPKPVIIDDVLADYLANPNLFTESNIHYISKSIAYENIFYNKVVKTKTNIARYKNISTAAIAEYLNANAVNTVRSYVEKSEEKTVTEKQTCRVLPSQIINSVIRLTSSDDTLSTLDNSYIYPMLRYNLTYKPVISDINIFADTDEFDKCIFSQTVLDTRHRLKVSKTISHSTTASTKYYEDYLTDLVKPNFYEHLISNGSKQASYDNLYWVANPSEFRSYSSFVMNTDDKLTISCTPENNVIDILSAFRNDMRRYCHIDDFNLTNEDKRKILNLHVNVTIDTVDNYDTEYYIIRSFIHNTLFKLYTITNVYNSDGQRLQFISDQDTVTILQTNPETVTVELTRNYKS